MTAFYALGGGWGHFSRIKSFIDQEKIESPIKVIASNPKAANYFDQEELVIVPEVAHHNAENLRSFISHIATSFQVKIWFIDTFPVGILGELRPEMFYGAEVNFLGRRLIWDTYSPLIKSPIPFKHVYRFESLDPSHQAYLDQYGGSTEEIVLSYPNSKADIIHPVLDVNKPIWLVVHTSEQSELEVLIEHALDHARIEQNDVAIVVLSDLEIESPEVYAQLLGENPRRWYGIAERIFTAGGFNTWYELGDHREKHICLPFMRKYDDQFWRCRQV